MYSLYTMNQQSLGNGNIIAQKQNGIDILNKSAASYFGNFAVDQPLETNMNIDPMKNEPQKRVYKRIYKKINEKIATENGPNATIEALLTKDKICQFYFASLSVVGLYVVYRMMNR
jgi:hypothetical protein